MGPELIAALSALLAAGITAGPAYMTARRSGKTAQHEGHATREAIAGLTTRLDVEERARRADRAETREDIRHLRRDVRAIREWQAGHDAEHVALRGK